MFFRLFKYILIAGSLLLVSCVGDFQIESTIGTGSHSVVESPEIFPLVERRLAVGSHKSAVLNSSDQVLIWGNNYHSSNGNYGQLGIGSSIAEVRGVPSVFSDTNQFLSVRLGEVTGCALTFDQRIKCWGAFAGVGVTGDVYVPTVISDSGSEKYIDLASGSYHSCAITELGQVKCWGDGWNGKLGNATTQTQESPVEVFVGQKFKKIAAGRNHTCAIDHEDKVFCWGANGQGQLGNGTFITPQLNAVMINDTTEYREIAAGENTTCGITAQGILKCWGQNSTGQLADGSTVSSAEPIVVDSGTSYAKISVGGSAGFHVCGITVQNKLKCWGSNSSGQIGVGTFGGTQATPVQIGTQDYSDVAASGSVTCALAVGGDLFCWGLNSNYQLGLGTNINQNSPQMVLSGL